MHETADGPWATVVGGAGTFYVALPDDSDRGRGRAGAMERTIVAQMAKAPRHRGTTQRTTLMRHRRFAIEFFRDFSASRAYDRAGYHAGASNTKQAAICRLLGEPTVQRFLQDEFIKLQQRVAIDQERHALEVCAVAFSNLTDLCSWGPDGVVLTPSAELRPEAARAVQTVKSTTVTREIGGKNAPPILETRTHVELQLHSKVNALSLLHQMYDKGQATKLALEEKLRALAALAGRYVPAADHQRYLAEVRVVLGDSGDRDGEAYPAGAAGTGNAGAGAAAGG